MSKHHNIDFVVDTEPMAREVHTVSRKVQETTGAVVAMKTAVIAAEKKCTDHVCQNVNRGFYALMHSQISQKIAAKQSRAEALLMELNAQKKRLLEIRSTMECDYHRISDRYARIITSLNKALKQRVQDLDRPVFNFCEREISIINNRVELLTATVPVCQLENITSSQQILASNIKHDSLKVIESTRSFLAQMNEQKLITDKILLNDIPSAEATRVLPVIVTVSTIDRQGNSNLMVNVPEDLSESNQGMIKNEVYDQFDSFSWKDAEMDEKVSQEFNALMANSSASDRVKETASKLFANSMIQNL